MPVGRHPSRAAPTSFSHSRFFMTRDIMDNTKIIQSTIKLIEESDMFNRDDQVQLLMGLYRMMNYELTKIKMEESKNG